MNWSCKGSDWTMPGSRQFSKLMKTACVNDVKRRSKKTSRWGERIFGGGAIQNFRLLRGGRREGLTTGASLRFDREWFSQGREHIVKSVIVFSWSNTSWSPAKLARSPSDIVVEVAVLSINQQPATSQPTLSKYSLQLKLLLNQDPQKPT